MLISNSFILINSFNFVCVFEIKNKRNENEENENKKNENKENENEKNENEEKSI